MIAGVEDFEEDPIEGFLKLRSAFLVGSNDDWFKAFQSGGIVGEDSAGSSVDNGRGSGEVTQP